jgi:GNAT superfamily N-acetyltransferase
MKTTHRAYQETAGDFNRLCRFVVDHDGYLRACATWSLGRLADWRYGVYDNKTTVPDFWDRNAQLWFDGFGDLAAFAISENGDSDFAIITAPGYRFLFAEILAWILDRWGDRGPRFSTEITAQQTLEIAALERTGFRRDSTFWTRRFDLTHEPVAQPPLQPGFTIVDMRSHPDYRAQRIMRAAAFRGQTSLSEEELQRQLTFYNYNHASPIYHPDTDLCVVAPDGRFAAGCEALIDARNLTADIERVCTHPDFRRRGFARAVIHACLCRLRDMGMRTAYIAGYSPDAIALYGSLGAVDESEDLVFALG